MRLPLHLAAVLAAAAQTADGIATGFLEIDVILSREDLTGTNAARAVSYSAAVRNIAPVAVTMRGCFSGSAVARDELTGRAWHLRPGQRIHVRLGEGPGPAMTDAEVRARVLLTCE